MIPHLVCSTKLYTGPYVTLGSSAAIVFINLKNGDCRAQLLDLSAVEAGLVGRAWPFPISSARLKSDSADEHISFYIRYYALLTLDPSSTLSKCPRVSDRHSVFEYFTSSSKRLLVVGKSVLRN